MILKYYTFLLGLVLFLCSCEQGKPVADLIGDYPDVIAKGAMKNVMWKGQLGGIIDLDTISKKNGLYGLGPVSFLQGELLMVDGQIFRSNVIADDRMEVIQPAKVAAPFLVYGHVEAWQKVALPATVNNIPSFEAYLDSLTVNYKRPFFFRLEGNVQKANIHIQNLPPGTSVSSPDEAHQGQVNYSLTDQEVTIIGVFSTEHQGVFTHHDSFIHMHLITTDHTKMGHLDKMQLVPSTLSLFLPVK